MKQPIVEYPPDACFLINDKIIQSANIQERKQSYTFPKHTHLNIELYLISKGSCEMILGKERKEFKVNDLIIILPYTVHSFATTGSTPCEFLHIHLHSSKLNQFVLKDEHMEIDLLSFLNPIRTYYHILSDEEINDLFYKIIVKTATESIFSSIYCNLHVIELLMNVIQKGDINAVFLNQNSKQKNEMVMFAIRYIHSHYAEKLHISHIAVQLNISNRYLSRLFFEAMNLSIHQYISMYRIEKAIELMMETEYSFIDIALSVGLNDAQHFSKLFSHVIGISPRKYKNLCRGIEKF